MDQAKLIKLLAVLVIAFLGAPFVVKHWPQPASFERAREAFAAEGMQVAGYQEAANPGLGSVAEAAMTVDGIRVNIYRFDNEGKIATQMEYQKKDAGTVIVESWGLAESLGAAPSRNLPSKAGRNGMYMIVATGANADGVNRVVAVFKTL